MLRVVCTDTLVFSNCVDFSRLPPWVRETAEKQGRADGYSEAQIRAAAETCFRVEEHGFSSELCGAHRPGHFTGVLTVVMKLLNLVRPNRAYFGEKDFQQLQLIRDMCATFFLDVEIVPCATVRESDGLALSSRNALLDPAGRRLAPRFHELLCSDLGDAQVRRELTAAGFTVDYVETRGQRRFGAVVVDCGDRQVRLIDNVARPAAAAAAAG